MVQFEQNIDRSSTREVGSYISGRVEAFNLQHPRHTLCPTELGQELSRLGRAFGVHTPLSVQEVSQLIRSTVARIPLKEFNLFSEKSTLAEGLRKLGVSSSENVSLLWLEGNCCHQAPLVALNGKMLGELAGSFAEDMIFLDAAGKWAGTVNESGAFGAVKIQDKYDHVDIPSFGLGEFNRCHADSHLNDHVHIIRGIHFLNLSGLDISQVYNWFPSQLKAERVVFFPDVTPVRTGKMIPTGTAVLTDDPNWRQYAVSDVGCGMQLIKSAVSHDDFKKSENSWEHLANELRNNRGKLGDLGGGNHFVDAIASARDGAVYFLIHTGSRRESARLDRLVRSPHQFDAKYSEIVAWARSNRDCVAYEIGKIYGKCEIVCDRIHNFHELQLDGSVLIRKGAVKAMPGTFTVIPSHMTGDVSLVVAGSSISNALYSLCHGTGRAWSRMDAWRSTSDQEIADARSRILIPKSIPDNAIRPYISKNYRELDGCYEQIRPVCTEWDRFAPLGYIGHL